MVVEVCPRQSGNARLSLALPLGSTLTSGKQPSRFPKCGKSLRAMLPNVCSFTGVCKVLVWRPLAWEWVRGVLEGLQKICDWAGNFQLEGGAETGDGAACTWSWKPLPTWGFPSKTG